LLPDKELFIIFGEIFSFFNQSLQKRVALVPEHWVNPYKVEQHLEVPDITVIIIPGGTLNIAFCEPDPSFNEQFVVAGQGLYHGVPICIKKIFDDKLPLC